MAEDVSGERIARQGLAVRAEVGVRAAVALAAGIQAQDAPASRLGVRARDRAATDADVVRAIVEDRTVVRSWLMRATIHLVDSADVRWMTALLGPMIRRRFGGIRWPELGLSTDVLARAEALAPEVLAPGPLTRHELSAALAERGVEVDPRGQAPTHLALFLSSLGLVCRGPDRGAQVTFTLLDSWLPEVLEGPRGDEALAELARRYFRAFSPATPADFTAWSGLPSARAIALIRDELTAGRIGGQAGYRLGAVEPERGLRLLPAFDNYLVGYRNRDLIIDRDRRAEVYVGGIIRPTVLLDGHVVGRWRLLRSGRSATVEVWPFAACSTAMRRLIEQEVDDVGRFLNMPVAATFRGD